MIDPIESLADCIMRFEGWFPPGSVTAPRGSTSWRNRNPGNLRPIIGTEPKDDKNYRVFDSLSDGWKSLIGDLTFKLNGHSEHNLTSQNTLHDLFNIYAPSLDNNDPQQYSRMIALWLSKIYNAQVTPDWKLQDILKLGK